MVVAYVRVSSRGQNVQTQRAAILRAAKARRVKVAKWYEDTASGATLRRPALQRLRDDARGGAFTTLYVYRLDRLSRGTINEALTVVQELAKHGVNIETIGDGFTLGGPAGDVVLAVLAWSAQMERTAIAERMGAARKRVEAAGGTWGRPRSLPDAKVSAIRKLRKEGRTVRAIAVALKVPHGTVQNVLSKKGAYKGATRAGTKAAKSKVAAPPSK
jgi:DNA invertase Pin-like site-specific DNA recombinase